MVFLLTGVPFAFHLVRNSGCTLPRAYGSALHVPSRLCLAKVPYIRSAVLLRFPAPEFGLPPRYPAASKRLRSNHLTTSTEMLYFICCVAAFDRTSNSLKSSCPIPLLSSRWIASVGLLESTLVDCLASVENKGLKETLTPFRINTYKKGGEGWLLSN